MELIIPILLELPHGDSIADEIRTWRLLNNMYQKKLAEQLGVDEITIINREQETFRYKSFIIKTCRLQQYLLRLYQINSDISSQIKVVSFLSTIYKHPKGKF